MNNLSRNVFISLVLGAVVGVFLPGLAPYVNFLGLIFKLSLQMIVMPIVLTSILCGLESIGDIRKLKSLGRRAILYYFSTTMIAIFIGMFLVNLLSPGVRPPKKEIALLIDEQEGIKTHQVVDRLKERLSKVEPFVENERLYLSLISHLDALAQSTTNIAKFKSETKNYLGSLELRSRLSATAIAPPVKPPSIQNFFEMQIRNALKNPFEALAKQQVLAVIVFTILLGAAMTTVGKDGEKFFAINRAVNMALIKMIGLIMSFAPLGVFGLLVSVISATGPEVFRELSLYGLCVISGLFIHLFFILPGLNYLFTKQSPKDFLLKLRPALLVAFSTSSSNASLPVTMQVMDENFKVDKSVTRFILPLGATVNMDGSALYEAVAAIFIAQLYGVSLDITGQLMVAITAAFAAIGTAGIPAAGTVTMAMILSAVGLPLEGVGLLLALDRPLDMCRTVVNVAGDAAGCSILSRNYLSAKKLSSE